MIASPPSPMHVMSTMPPANTLPLQPPARYIEPDDAVDLVMSRCLRGACFGPEKDFWDTFSCTYSQVEEQVDPDRRFAFSIRVDSRLAQMGLAPWSVMSRVIAAEAAGGSARAP